ncbi:MAG TPA: type II toxin-antitoxin system RelE/ParE family toxin [Ideonella sp.]|nr:type II toxin-antitoxin system RelE/ParE family toxin [Ideonella sp.]
MPRVLRRPLAGEDIAQIWDYIAEGDLQQADAWVDRLDGKLQLLATQPKMGRARDELAPHLRSMPLGRYLIFYLPLDDGIDVVRVLHSARDLESLFTNEPPLP